jgi:hypothetical protein
MKDINAAEDRMRAEIDELKRQLADRDAPEGGRQRPPSRPSTVTLVLLGLLILALIVLAWRHRVATTTTTAMAGVVVCQALLGMWMVTLLLKPVVVTAHLLGGMTTLTLLVWLYGRETTSSLPINESSRLAARVAINVRCRR